MMNLDDANTYFNSRFNSDLWMKLTNDVQQSALNTAEIILKGAYTFKGGFEDQPNYQHAVYEQAYHLIAFDKERFRLQQEGVSVYQVDDMQFTMSESLISPLANTFLKPLIYKKSGSIV